MLLAYVFLGVLIALFVPLFYLHGTASPVPTERHTIENYHGNWASTWHTPWNIRAITAVAIMQVVSLALCVFFGLMGI